MRSRAPVRWKTEFGLWIAEVGVSAIVRALQHDPDLRVTPGAVYEWLQGHAPSYARARALVRMSGGRLTIEAIYRHGSEVKKGAPCESTSRSTAQS